MSNIAIKGAVTGTGTFTLESPATNTDRVFTLPDNAGTVLTNASDLVAANLTGSLPAISGAALTSLSAANLTGSLPAISGAALTNLPQSGAVRQVVGDTTNAQTGVTGAAGAVVLQATTAALASTSSRLFITCSAFGSASDDSSAFLEYSINGGSFVRDTNLNGSGGSAVQTAALMDFSVTRALEGGTLIAASTQLLWSPNTTGTVSIRLVFSMEGGTGYLNRGLATSADLYNHGKTKSSLTIMEIV